MPHSFRAFSPLWLEFGRYQSFSDIGCFVNDLTQPIEWFRVGPIKSSLLHFIHLTGTPSLQSSGVHFAAWRMILCLARERIKTT